MNAIAQANPCDELKVFSDEELFVEYRTFGGIRYFEELVRRYRPLLASFLRRRYGFDDATLDEALQATFTRVWEKRDQFDATRALRSWIFRIADSQAVNLIRKASSGVATTSLDALIGSDDSARALLDDVRSRDPDPSFESEHADSMRWVREAAARLPERYRDVVDMVFFQGMTRGSAAQALNLALATVSNRIERALELLSASLFSGGFGEASDRLFRYVESEECV